VKDCVTPPVATLAVVGETTTTIAGGVVIVIVAVADFVPSATEIALSVRFAELGTAGGAVYVTEAPEALELAERVPQVAPLHPEPASIQLTPLALLSFATVAVNIAACPVCIEAVVGEIATETGVGAGAVGAAGVLMERPPHPTTRSIPVRRMRADSGRTGRPKFILPRKGDRAGSR
jgi:hypothetical protein